MMYSLLLNASFLHHPPLFPAFSSFPQCAKSHLHRQSFSYTQYNPIYYRLISTLSHFVSCFASISFLPLCPSSAHLSMSLPLLLLFFLLPVSFSAPSARQIFGLCPPGQGRLPTGACVPCLPGYFSLAPSDTECQICDTPFFRLPVGAPLCNPCLFGFYQPSAGSTACLPCPTGFSIQGFASTSIDQCVGCEGPTFLSKDTNLCTPCPSGRARNGTLDEPAPNNCPQCKEGFATAMQAATECEKCADDEVAKQGSSFCTKCPSGTVPSTRRNECVPIMGGMTTTPSTMEMDKPIVMTTETPSTTASKSPIATTGKTTSSTTMKEPSTTKSSSGTMKAKKAKTKKGPKNKGGPKKFKK